MNLKRFGMVVAMALVGAGCTEHVMVPQLVRSYRTDWPQAVGPDGRALASSVTVLVANEPYLRDQCANSVPTGGAPLDGAGHLARFGCTRIAPGDRPEIVVPDSNEQAAVTHQLEHLRGRWCHDAQGDPVPCAR